jgi:Calmodulin-binding
MMLMPEEERLDTLEILKASKVEALKQLQALPFVIETPSLIRKQSMLENKLQEIDNAMNLFNKPKVYIARE